MSLEMNSLLAVSGVGPSTVQALIDGGFSSLEQVKATPAEELTAVKGIGAATAAAILEFLANASGATDAVQTYRYDEIRNNIPPAGLAAQSRIEERPKVRYSYDPHLPPELRFDSTGKADALPELLEEARQRPLNADEIKKPAEALRTQQPWLEQVVLHGIVKFYARNDGLGFSIPYEFMGVPHHYEPDFLIRLANDVTLVFEIKGAETEQDRAKHESARRWRDAVNHWGN